MKKRWLLFLIIACLLLVNSVNLVYAQDTIDTNESKESTDSDVTSGISGIGNKTNDALEKDIVIPENLQIFARVLFGVKGAVNLAFLTVLICLWIGLVILIQKILQFIPIFDGRKSWLMSIIIVILISITGILNTIINFWFDFANIFGILEKWPILRVVAVVLLVLIIVMGISILLDYFRKKTGEDVAEMEGYEAGVGARMLKTVADVFRKVNG